MALPYTTRAIGSADEALSVFERAVGNHRHDGTNIDDLRNPLRQFCANARRERMAPEHVLICVKHALGGLPVSDIDHSSNDSIRNRIITLAITAYYDDFLPKTE